MYEPGCPISAVTCRKKILVGKDQIVQRAYHDFASIMPVPTVVMVQDLPSSVDQSWYHGKPYVYIEITATEPSSAIQNRDWEGSCQNIWHHRKHPSNYNYTNGSPETCTNFLPVKIAIILCQRSLNSDTIIALQTAPGHSFKNPVERVNCILNLGLHGMRVMHKNIYQSPEFTKT